MRALIVILLVASVCLATCQAALLRLSASQKQAILRKHNSLRSQTARGLTRGQPPASNMAELVWDDRLMHSANRWVQQCRAGHDRKQDRALPEFSWVGQNWAGGSYFDTSRYIQLWFDEYRHFNFNANRCSRVCGHYTQIVWAKTTRVGCGVARCGGSLTYHFVCNYATGGNFNHQRPYRGGPAASQCGREFRRIRGGLCVA